MAERINGGLIEIVSRPFSWLADRWNEFDRGDKPQSASLKQEVGNLLGKESLDAVEAQRLSDILAGTRNLSLERRILRKIRSAAGELPLSDFPTYTPAPYSYNIKQVTRGGQNG